LHVHVLRYLSFVIAVTVRFSVRFSALLFLCSIGTFSSRELGLSWIQIFKEMKKRFSIWEHFNLRTEDLKTKMFRKGSPCGRVDVGNLPPTGTPRQRSELRRLFRCKTEAEMRMASAKMACWPTANTAHSSHQTPTRSSMPSHKMNLTSKQ